MNARFFKILLATQLLALATAGASYANVATTASTEAAVTMQSEVAQDERKLTRAERRAARKAERQARREARLANRASSPNRVQRRYSSFDRFGPYYYSPRFGFSRGLGFRRGFGVSRFGVSRFSRFGFGSRFYRFGY